jgi:O-methyltransferase involved in polyketide biosynthesis
VSFISFAREELSSALAKGVRQCVVIGSRPLLSEVLESSPDEDLRVFAVEEEPLAAALDKSAFDKRKASLFIWLGGAGYRTVDAVLAGFAFIASLPKGSGVVFDYTVERTSPGSLTQTALDALASRISMAGGSVKYLIQPQAVTAMLHALGFQRITDLALEGLPPGGGRLVSAAV